MLLKTSSNGSEAPKSHAAPPVDCAQVSGYETGDEPGKAIRLLQRAITFLAGPPVPAVLRAFDQLGIPAGLVADVLGIDRGALTAWRRGQSEIPEEHRVMLLTYLSVLLPWLYGAEGHLTGHASPLPFWRQRTQAARKLLDVEMRTAPLLVHRARALANIVDAVARRAAARAAVARAQQPKRIPTRTSARKAVLPREVSRRAG